MRPLCSRQQSTRRAFLALLGGLPATYVGLGRARGQTKAPDRDESKERWETMRRLARASRLAEVADGKPSWPVALRAEPLVRYNDPPRGIQDGTLWGWGDHGRVTATLKVEHWTNPDGGHWSFGVASLATAPLEMTFSDGTVQTLRKPAWQPQTINAAPPAGSAVQRLVQMKTLARRFAVSVRSVHNPNPLELRLLPTAVDRYDDPASGILDGAVFGLSFGTNPNVLLAIEAVKASAGNSWQFGFARQGSGEMVARLDNKEVWTQPFALAPGDSDIYTVHTISEDAAAR